MKVIHCSTDHASQILEIFNEAILNSVSLYDYKPLTMADMERWFEIKISRRYPVVGVVDDQNQLMGFGSFGVFRERPAYKYTVEHSLYVHKDRRGKGVGKIILSEIINEATKRDYHCLVAGIDSTNEASVQLHKSFGFEYCGKIRHAAYKFSRWLDLEFYQLILGVPLKPNED